MSKFHFSSLGLLTAGLALLTNCKTVKPAPGNPYTALADTGNIINNKKTSGTNTYVIVYDLAKHHFTTNMVHPRIHSPVVFRIDNINRFAYDTKITSHDSILTLSTEKDTLAKAKSHAEAPPASNEVKAVLEQNELQVSTSQLKSKTNEAVLKTKAKELNTYFSNQNALQKKWMLTALKVNGKKPDSLLHNEIPPYKIDPVLENQIGKLKSEYASVDNFNNNLFHLRQSYVSLYQAYQNIRDLYLFKDRILNIAADPRLNYQKFKQLNSRLIEYSKQNDFYTQTRQQIKNFNESWAQVNDYYQSIESEKDLHKSIPEEWAAALKNQAKLVYTQADNTYKKIKIDTVMKDLESTQDVINWLSDPENYTVSSTPIQPSQDAVVFDIRIQDKNTSKKDKVTDACSFNYREFVRGGVRYDFSTGLVLSMGIGNNSYRTEAVGADSSRIVRNKRTNLYLPAIAAMVHASLRSWRTTTVGFTLGASLNASTLDINSLFPGISLMVGKSEKWIFTAGPALQKVDYLNSQYSTNKTYATSSLPASIPTEKIFRLGTFIGVSYNLTKKQKDNFKLLKD